MTKQISKSVSVPQSRIARSAAIGGTATRIFGNVALAGMGQLAQGKRPSFQDLLVTPGNIQRLTSQLARMRGAAMKLGQLVSMDAGDVLPAELTDILARLRADADFMPPKQLKQVLNAAWGEGWLKKFASFDVRPIAAASIGQVHRAKTKDGKDIVLKVQYPGVRKSIDSDVDNVGSLLRISGLLPDGFDLSFLLEEAKKQLHQEADYTREASHLGRFGDHVGADDRFVVPGHFPEFSTDTVLAMSYVPGRPIEEAVDLSLEDRSRLVADLFELTFREIFDWRHMQTDPNFANYRFDPQTGRIALLDFGAAFDVPDWVSSGYRKLVTAGLTQDDVGLTEAGLSLGFWSNDLPKDQIKMTIDMVRFSFDLLSRDKIFDFADPQKANEMRERGYDLANEASLIHFPPIETLLVQRKLAGMFLLARKLGARTDLLGLIKSRLDIA